MHPRGGGTLSCEAALNDANVNFAAVFFDCIGTSEAAWTSQVNAIPDTFVQCSAGCTAGTVILRDQTRKGEAIGSIQMQCNPASAFVNNEGTSGCTTIGECNDFSCSLSTPPVAAHVNQATISKECVTPVSGRRRRLR